MSQTKGTEYTPDEALQLVMKTLRTTHPSPKAAAMIDEIEGEIEARRAHPKRQKRVKRDQVRPHEAKSA